MIIEFASVCQCVSPDPYELLWNRYGIEQDSLFIAENNISSVTSSRVIKIRKGEVRRTRHHYQVRFNEHNLPSKYTYFLEFRLRKDYRYSPFWRLKNDYPVYSIWTYELFYDSLNRLQEICEIKHRTNSPAKFYRKIKLHYDSANRLNLQQNAQYSFINLGGQDTVLDFNVDSIHICYITDSSGILYNSRYYQNKDTLHWVGKPYQQILSADGRKYPIPTDVNSKTLETMDGINYYLFNESGLPIRKEVIIGSLEGNISMVNYHSIYSIEYEFRDNKP